MKWGFFIDSSQFQLVLILSASLPPSLPQTGTKATRRFLQASSSSPTSSTPPTSPTLPPYPSSLPPSLPPSFPSTQELRQLGDFCKRHNLLLLSDEIYHDLILDPVLTPHVPIAALEDPELMKRTIILHAASKTYNVPGLSCAYAIIPDLELRTRFKKAAMGFVTGEFLLLSPVPSFLYFPFLPSS